jgi:putative nucleotidyltransferase-like protein
MGNHGTFFSKSSFLARNLQIILFMKERIEIPLEDSLLLDLVIAAGTGSDSPSPDIYGSLRFGKLLEQGLRHKLLPILSHFLNNEAKDVALPRFSRRILRDLDDVNSRRHIRHVQEAFRVQQALLSKGINSLVRKGVIYPSLVGGGRLLRMYHDIDLYVEDNREEEITSVMFSLGYVLGKTDKTCGSVIEWGREQILMHKLYPDHLPRFAKSDTDPFSPTFTVDFSVDIGWVEAPLSDDRRELLSDMLRNPEIDKTTSLCTLPLHMHFIDCALHFFRDAYYERHIRDGSDVHLSKFLDLALLWSVLDAREIQRLRDRIAFIGAGSLVSWVLYHVDQIMGTSISGKLDLPKSDVPPDSWLSSQGEVKSWKGGMLERLFAEDRIPRFEGMATLRKQASGVSGLTLEGPRSPANT